MEQPWTTPAELDSYALKMYREKHPDWIPTIEGLYDRTIYISSYDIDIELPAHWAARIINKHLTKQEWELLDKVINPEVKQFAGKRCNFLEKTYSEYTF